MAIRKTARQLRSENNLLKITEAASELFSQYGFERVTVDDLCEAAGVSKSTFYLLFQNKEDLLMLYACEDRHRYIVQHYSYSDEVPLDELFRRFFHVNFDYNLQIDRAQNRSTYISYIKTFYGMRSPKEDVYTTELMRLIDCGIREGAFRQNLTAYEYFRYIHDWMIGFFIGWSLQPDNVPSIEETYLHIMDAMVANLLK